MSDIAAQARRRLGDPASNVPPKASQQPKEGWSETVTTDEPSKSSRTPRPHHKLMDDGRRVREVLSYTRRGSRFSSGQANAWAAHHEKWVIPDAAVDQPGFCLADWFGRSAPLIVEVGPGVGEATAALAATRPAYDVLAFEVWTPGIAEGLGRVAEAGASNVRFCSIDAAWSLEHLIAPGGLAELWTFFPDPWHKKKHHKRRLITPTFARIAAARLAPGGVWRLATDRDEYAELIMDVLDAEPLLDGGVVQRWDERPVTKFERKGVNAGRSVTDLVYARTSP